MISIDFSFLYFNFISYVKIFCNITRNKSSIQFSIEAAKQKPRNTKSCFLFLCVCSLFEIDISLFEHGLNINYNYIFLVLYRYYFKNKIRNNMHENAKYEETKRIFLFFSYFSLT